MHDFSPSKVSARSATATEPKGNIGVAANWVCGTYGVPWWSVESQSGGPVNEQATHLFDLTRYLIGEVRQVCAIAGQSKDATCSFSLAFENGSVGSIFYSCGSSEKAIRTQVFTTDETIHAGSSIKSNLAWNLLQRCDI